MAMSKKWDLVIIGGGGGGLLLSLLLGRKGFRVAILEKHAKPVSLPRGEIIQPGGLKILDENGLLKKLLPRDIHQNRQVHFSQSNGTPLSTIDYQRLPPPYSYSLLLLPEVISELLLQEIDACPNISIFWGASFQSPILEGEFIIGVEANYNGVTERFCAPVAIGADGAGSPFRSALPISSRLYPYRDGYLTALVPRPDGFLNESRYVLGRQKILGLFPVSSQMLYLFYMIQKDHLTKIRTGSLASFKKELCLMNPAILALLEKPLLKIQSWDELSFMPCFRVTCDRWVTNGAALIGDAAHAMNPHVAQGRNSAMEDAMALATVLEACFAKGDFSQKTLSEYEAARRPAVEILQRFGDEMAFFWNSGFPPVVWARNLSFKALHKNRGLHDKILKTVSGIEVKPLSILDRFQMLDL